MKLLAVSSWFPCPPDNGSKLRAFHLLSQLANHHDITLLSFAESNEEGNQRGRYLETPIDLPERCGLAI
jgi:hypothetical protein